MNSETKVQKPQNELREYLARMKFMNRWERLHPQQLDPEQSLNRLFDLVEFLDEFKPEKRPRKDTRGIERMLHIFSHLP